MIDNRIYTFLKLCEVMNYRKTAELLNMTQPAVTQHIHSLENQYKCKLFKYERKVLSKTDYALKLESHARSIVYNDKIFNESFLSFEKTNISIGATKTIGDYMVNDAILQLLKNENMHINFVVDNTRHLFEQLNTFELDFLMIEGYFDKNKYDYKLMQTEELVGICSKNHPFSNKTILLDEIFLQHIILREEGSGTKKVFENFLQEQNHSFDQFLRTSTVSSFNVIMQAVAQDIGISFVYNALVTHNDNLATFKIKNYKIFHELNYVFLKNTRALSKIKLLTQ